MASEYGERGAMFAVKKSVFQDWNHQNSANYLRDPSVMAHTVKDELWLDDISVLKIPIVDLKDGIDVLLRDLNSRVFE